MIDDYLDLQAQKLDMFQSQLYQDQIFYINPLRRDYFEKLLQEEKDQCNLFGQVANINGQTQDFKEQSMLRNQQIGQQQLSLEINNLFQTLDQYAEQFELQMVQDAEKKVKKQKQPEILGCTSIRVHQTTNNIPKFLLKIAKQYFPQDCQTLVPTGQLYPKFHRFFKRIVNRRSMPNLRILHRLLNMQLLNIDDHQINRKIMWYILGKRKKQTILDNKKVMKKCLYSTSAKVFRLRCRSSELISRSSLK